MSSYYFQVPQALHRTGGRDARQASVGLEGAPTSQCLVSSRFQHSHSQNTDKRRTSLPVQSVVFPATGEEGSESEETYPEALQGAVRSELPMNRVLC